jgi:hypothetical protein
MGQSSGMTPDRDVTVCGAATYLVCDEALSGVRAGRGACANGRGLRCLHAKSGRSRTGGFAAARLPHSCTAGHSRGPRPVRPHRHPGRRRFERPLGRRILRPDRGRAGLCVPTALLVCDHGAESVASSGHADRRARARPSAARPAPSCHAGAARSAAPGRRGPTAPADQALERSSREARDDPARSQRRRAVELPDAALRLPAAPPESHRPRLVRAQLSPARRSRWPPACCAAKRGIQPRARPDHSQLFARPRLNQSHVRQRRMHPRAQGCHRLPSHVTRNLGKLPGRRPPMGLPPPLFLDPGVLLHLQNVALVPSSLGEIVERQP